MDASLDGVVRQKNHSSYGITVHYHGFFHGCWLNQALYAVLGAFALANAQATEKQARTVLLLQDYMDDCYEFPSPDVLSLLKSHGFCQGIVHVLTRDADVVKLLERAVS